MRRGHGRYSGAELVAGFEKKSSGALMLAVCLSDLLASLTGLAPQGMMPVGFGAGDKGMGAGREDVCVPLEMR